MPLSQTLRLERAFRLLLPAAIVCLPAGIALARENLWSRMEYRHVCHNCGAIRVTRSWSLLRIQGPSEVLIESSATARHLGVAGNCEHHFIHSSSCERRLALNPALCLSQAVHTNSAINRLVNNDTFGSALAELAAAHLPATGIWANVCLYSFRPGNSNINPVLQMVAANAQASEIARFLRSNPAFNPAER